MEATTMMRTICASIAYIVTAAVLANPVSAGIIFASGDANLGNPIDGSSAAPVTPGNSTFFENILGDGTNVLIYDEFYGGAAADSTDAINDFYNSLSGVTSNLDVTGTAITSGDLAGSTFFSVLCRITVTRRARFLH